MCFKTRAYQTQRPGRSWAHRQDGAVGAWRAHQWRSAAINSQSIVVYAHASCPAGVAMGTEWNTALQAIADAEAELDLDLDLAHIS